MQATHRNPALWLIMIVVIAVCHAPARGQCCCEASEQNKESLEAVILDFQSGDLPPEVGGQIREVLAIALSQRMRVKVLDTQTVRAAMTELKLDGNQVISTSQAVELGQKTGADIVITGRVFRVEDRLFVTAKLIGSRTCTVKGAIVQTDNEADRGATMLQLTEKIIGVFDESSAQLSGWTKVKLDPQSRLTEAAAAYSASPAFTIAVAQPVTVTVPPDTTASPPEDSGLQVSTPLVQSLRDVGLQVRDAQPAPGSDVDLFIADTSMQVTTREIGSLWACTANATAQVIHRDSPLTIVDVNVTAETVDATKEKAVAAALNNAGRMLATRLLQLSPPVQQSPAPDVSPAPVTP